MIPNDCAIVVMDVGTPESVKGYSSEPETNDLFVRYLNSRLWNLRIKGAKLIECNYLSQTHRAITVNFDLKTLNADELEKFVIDKQLKKLIYTGYHYGHCTHVGRETGGVYMLKRLKDCKVYVAPSLCRPLIQDYWRQPKNWQPELPNINL